MKRTVRPIEAHPSHTRRLMWMREGCPECGTVGVRLNRQSKMCAHCTDLMHVPRRVGRRGGRGAGHRQREGRVHQQQDQSDGEDGHSYRNIDNLVALLMLRCSDVRPEPPGRRGGALGATA